MFIEYKRTQILLFLQKIQYLSSATFLINIHFYIVAIFVFVFCIQPLYDFLNANKASKTFSSSTAPGQIYLVSNIKF